jgi:hypothetical protein
MTSTPSTAPDFALLMRANISTMIETVARLDRRGMSHSELDKAIEETEEALERCPQHPAAPAPQVDEAGLTLVVAQGIARRLRAMFANGMRPEEAEMDALCDFILKSRAPHAAATVTDSCGCVFCDLDLAPKLYSGPDLYYAHQTKHGKIKCTRQPPSAAPREGEGEGE